MLEQFASSPYAAVAVVYAVPLYVALLVVVALGLAGLREGCKWLLGR